MFLIICQQMEALLPLKADGIATCMHTRYHDVGFGQGSAALSPLPYRPAVVGLQSASDDLLARQLLMCFED